MENRGEKAETLFYMISGWYGEIPENSGYFHATYRQEHPVQKGRSYVILDGVHGKGCFAGVTLASGMNGHNTCWVEGEAKMYIDGDTYPTMNYTGTEDYFCGSYGFGNDIYLNRYQTFSGLYTGLYAILGDTKEMYNHQKRFMLYRWHVKDPVYFDEDFKMTIDNLGLDGPALRRLHVCGILVPDGAEAGAVYAAGRQRAYHGIKKQLPFWDFSERKLFCFYYRVTVPLFDAKSRRISARRPRRAGS